jgi:hypothetical protein
MENKVMVVGFTIPIWLIWLMGITGGIVVIGLAVIGVMFLYIVKGFF